MSKLNKLYKQPLKSVNDFAHKRLPIPKTTKLSLLDNLAKLDSKLTDSHDSIIYVIGFSTWKTYLRKYFHEHSLIFIDKNISEKEFNKKLRWSFITGTNVKVFIWGYKAPSYLLKFLEEKNIETRFVEDGFIRSVGLGASKEPPMSLCLDAKGAYFDANRQTELENLLNTYDCSEELLQRANSIISKMIELEISKYNHAVSVDIQSYYGHKNKKRVLVIGQVEDDASLAYGQADTMTNNDLVRLAVIENPDAQVFYKVHPDVLNGYRDYQSSPVAVQSICHVMSEDIPLAQALQTIDHVYTMTSLSGIEALIRGIKVTALGMPFYAGWGLTDDRQVSTRRQRNLNISELFAIAYIIYPKYFDIYNGNRIEIEDVIARIAQAKKLRTMASYSDTIIENTQTDIKKGIYRHYSGKLYEVLYVAKDVERNNLEIIVCRKLHDDYAIETMSKKYFKNSINSPDGDIAQFRLIKHIV